MTQDLDINIKNYEFSICRGNSINLRLSGHKFYLFCLANTKLLIQTQAGRQAVKTLFCGCEKKWEKKLCKKMK